MWRHHLAASLLLALVAGLAASVVGASFQAADRASTSLERYTARSRTYDEFVSGCPPGVDPNELNGIADLLLHCTNPQVANELRAVLSDLPGVEQTTVASIFVVGLLDPSVSNGWGRLTLLGGTATPGSPPAGHPIVLDGRLADPTAPDEIVVSTVAATAAGLHVGDTVRLAAWRQQDLDAAIDGSVAPTTSPFTSKVVGVVRSLDDLQSTEAGNLSDAIISGNINLYVAPGWVAVHGSGLPGYGTGVMVRLRGGASAKLGFQELMNTAPSGWMSQVSDVGDSNPATVQHVIDLERQAVLIFAAIAIVAAVTFVGLTTTRHLQRAAEGSLQLRALGMTHRDLRLVNAARSLTIGTVAAAVSAIGVVALSPVGPVGIARDLEFDLGVHLSATVMGITVAALIGLFVLTGLLTPTALRRPRQAGERGRASLVDRVLRAGGPVSSLGTTIARGRTSRVAIGVTAIAVAAAAAAGSITAGYDRLVGDPSRFGAAWDVVVGQYSEQAAFDAGVAALRDNPAVVAAAGFAEQTDVGSVGRLNPRFLALSDFIGHTAPVITTGRAPADDTEAALARDTARRLHRSVGDEITVLTNADLRLRLRVVGIVVVNDPVSTQARPGDGVLVTPATFGRIAGPGAVANSIVVGLDPGLDRSAAIDAVRQDFPGSIRAATPQVDLRNVGRLGAVPWAIAALVVALALATVLHALITMMGRSRTALAVMAALGLTRGQRRSVGVLACMSLVAIGVAIGVPSGLVLGARTWDAVAASIDLPSPSVISWSTVAAVVAGALGVAGVVAIGVARGPLRTVPGNDLRVE
jgi:ABC-type lipoprotein release transport system permease subunit